MSTHRTAVRSSHVCSRALLLLFNTTRAHTPGPPSTRTTDTMDGGVADTTRTNTTVLTQAVNRRVSGRRERLPSICASLVPLLPRM